MRLGLLKFLLWLASVSHFVLGLCGVTSPQLAVKAAKLFYGAQLDATPVAAHILRILGAYMLAVGILAAVAALNPARYRPLIVVLASLLALRVLQRLVYAEEIQATFQISGSRIWIQSVYFGLYAAALLYLLPRRNDNS
jgi:hypothetical protein